MSDLLDELRTIQALRNPAVREAALAQLRAEHGAAVDAALVAMEPGASVRQSLVSEGGGRAENNRQVYVAPGASYAEAADPAQRRAERALGEYLRVLSAQCRTVQLAELDEADARFAQAMSLEQIYIGLHVTRQIEDDGSIDFAGIPEQRRGLIQRVLGWLSAPLTQLRGEPDAQPTPRLPARAAEARPLRALEALARAPNRRLMLLGEPGSGKSTLVKYLALVLADAGLARDAPNTADDLIKALPSWQLGRPLPILIVLRDLAAFIASRPADHDALALFEAFLAHSLRDNLHPAIELLLGALGDGKAIVLFDGLDEVVGAAVLRRVTTIISTVAATYRAAPILVTCRVRDYQQNALRQIPGFPDETLAPFNDGQIEAFVKAWYRELTATNRKMLGTPEQLIESIDTRPELAQLARLPLLLTMMAILHAGKNTLPAARALLYDQCIQLLLLRWRKEPGSADVLEQLQLPEFGPDRLLKLMARLGFLAHENAARSQQRSDEGADLSREQVLQTLEETFTRYVGGDERRRDQLVGIVLHELAKRNGLLIQRSAEGGEQYAFPHRTFQEFLAGDHIRRNREYLDLALKRAPQQHWHEALTLMVGYQARTGANLALELDLIRTLLKRTPIEQVLAGELLAELGRASVAEYNAAEVARDGVWGVACRQLLAVAAAGQPPQAPAALRARAGLALGQLSCGTATDLARGSLPFQGDPRLPLLYVRWPNITQSASWRKMWQQYWCAIEHGTFWHGDDRTEQLRQVRLDHDYKIARYPITNAEYAQFITAGGYVEKRWWTEEGWKYRESEAITQPRLWHNSAFNNPLQPVVGITWYEAAAYCAWLTEQGQQQGWLPQDETIRLPTWLEWERAARHTDQRRYPWGPAEPTPEHANYAATQIGAPAPVGCFPLGAAMCGALDLVGNMMEWTATSYQQPDGHIPKKDFRTSDGVMLSYSDYSERVESLCCGARNGNFPISWGNLQGMRVVASRALM